MSKLIDWYLVELRLRLNGSLSQDRIEAILKEAEAHLLESIRSRMDAAVTELAATEAAIREYGSPDRVAKGYLNGRPQKLYGLNAAWVALVAGFVAIYCWNFHWLTLGGYFDHFGETWQNGIAGMVGVAALYVLFQAARTGLRSFRLAITGMTVAVAALSVPLLSFWIIPAPNYYQGVSRLHLGRDVPKIERTVGTLDAYQAFLTKGIREYSVAISPASLSADLTDSTLAAREMGVQELNPAAEGSTLDRGGPYVVPRGYGVFAEVDGRVWGFETMASFDDAKRAWTKSCSQDLAGIARQRSNLEGLLKNAREAQAGRLFFFDPRIYSQTVFGTIVLLPLLLLVDWIGALSARPRRRWPDRALA